MRIFVIHILIVFDFNFIYRLFINKFAAVLWRSSYFWKFYLIFWGNVTSKQLNIFHYIEKLTFSNFFFSKHESQPPYGWTLDSKNIRSKGPATKPINLNVLLWKSSKFFPLNSIWSDDNMSGCTQANVRFHSKSQSVTECTGVINKVDSEFEGTTYDRKCKIIWYRIIVLGALHLGAIYATYLVYTSAKIFTLIFGK